MIKNLNTLSFADYGTIRADRSSEDRLPWTGDWQQITLPVSGSATEVYRVEENAVCMDYEEGMTVLAVSKDMENYQYFYLDKPVSIRPGVAFSVIPYQNSCTVRLAVLGGEGLTPVGHLDPKLDLSVHRTLRLGNIHTFFYQEKERGFSFRGESHDLLELTYVDKGRIHSVTDGVEMTLEQGNIVVYGSGQWHMQYADLDCAANFVTITFDLLGGDLNTLLNRKFTANQRTADLLQRMLRERDREDRYSADMVVCYLGLLLLNLQREGQEETPGKLRTANAINSENSIIGHAQKYISENVMQKLTVPMVAKEVGVSPSYLTALFHRSLQISPGEYIRRSKLQEGKQLIREGKMNFTEIAQVLQYSTVHHFSRQFKEKFGITPTEYAKSVHR